MKKDCKDCKKIKEFKNFALYQIKRYEEELKKKPSTIQIISLAFSSFALGFSISTLLKAIMQN